LRQITHQRTYPQFLLDEHFGATGTWLSQPFKNKRLIQQKNTPFKKTRFKSVGH
jgi:hypothetical protein